MGEEFGRIDHQIGIERERNRGTRSEKGEMENTYAKTREQRPRVHNSQERMGKREGKR